MNEITGQSKIKNGINSPPHFPHEIDKFVKQERSFHLIMRDKDSFHKNVEFANKDKEYYSLVQKDYR